MEQIDIQKLLSLGLTTFAINNHEFKTDFVTFVDQRIADLHEQLKGTIITQSRHKVREPFIHFDDFRYDFTHDYLLKWLHGRCTRAILVGAADFVGNKRYNTRIGHESDKFEPCKACINRSIKFIEGITDFKIYKMNENGILNVPIINVEDLLNDCYN